MKSLLADWKLTLALVGAALAAIAMIAYAFIRPAVDLEEDERKRRLHLNQIGRIAEGQVVELVEYPPEPKTRRKKLFGSRARGDARPDSDYDVAVFLKTLPDRWTELDRLARLRVDLLDETDAFFDAMPYPAEAYQERSPLMHEIREDGLPL